MQDHQSTSSPSPSAAARIPPKSQRILACILCQQRKVKCDRKFPCANCVKASTKCVPATLLPRQRRRRPPERELLERLRHYEDLLRQNNIKFEQLPKSALSKTSPSDDDGDSDTLEETASAAGLHNEQPGRGGIGKSSTVNIWHAMNAMDLQDGEPEKNDQQFEGSNSQEYVAPSVIKQSWDDIFESKDDLLFGSSETDIDLSTLHPGHTHIFKLWQVFLENVNPVLKVTHSPTLQMRIIDGASNLANISPELEAMMFAVYCVSIVSLDNLDCQTTFGSTKGELLSVYQFACQHALHKCAFLRNKDRECLTALFLYLVSVRTDAHPRALHAMLGSAIRIAQLLGLNMESTYQKGDAFENEMGRRLWWSLIIFDHRVCEMTDGIGSSLVPTWDCKVPLNVSDFDLRPDMKVLPQAFEQPTETILAVVRCEMAEFMRYTTFHLDFTNPLLKGLAREVPHDVLGESVALDKLEATLETKYLRLCNPEIPLQHLTIWLTRCSIAKLRLLEHYSRISRSSTKQTDAQRDVGASHALRMLQSDTNLVTEPAMQGYLWFISMYFQFPAYIHVLQDLRKRPYATHAEKAWEVMSANWQARYVERKQNDKAHSWKGQALKKDPPVTRVFQKIALHSWDACEQAFASKGRQVTTPAMVLDIRQKVMQAGPTSESAHVQQLHGGDVAGLHDEDMMMLTNIAGYSRPLDMRENDAAYTETQNFPNMMDDVLKELGLDIDDLNSFASQR